MRRFQPLLFTALIGTLGLLSACSDNTSQEKAFVGTWVQETPYSITDRGINTTTTNTVLRLKRNGETYLSRNLDIVGQDLPDTGISVSVELRGSWDLIEDHLRQSPDTVLIMPRNDDPVTRQWADKLQTQAEQAVPSVKAIIAANKKQLILQDLETGTTDVYKRK